MFLLLLAPSASMAVIYWFFLKNITKSVVAAHLLMGIYLILVFNTEIPLGSRMGGLYGTVPIVSFSVIIFSEIIDNQPREVTVFLGFLGLIVATLALLYFKLYVWG